MNNDVDCKFYAAVQMHAELEGTNASPEITEI